MSWAPRGSWCAHISSRTTACSQTEAPRPPNDVVNASSARARQAIQANHRSRI